MDFSVVNVLGDLATSDQHTSSITNDLARVALCLYLSLLITRDQACITRPRRTRHLLHDLDYPTGTCQTVTYNYRDHIATLALSDL